MKYKHAEAYCLMTYACTNIKCNHLEKIWNSRDGVTPFGCQCPSCGQATLMHYVRGFIADPQENYKLNHGQKFWRNMHAHEAIDILNSMIAQIKKQGGPITDEQISSVKKTRLEEVKNGIPFLDIYIKPL